jgi:hypothetical protein
VRKHVERINTRLQQLHDGENTTDSVLKESTQQVQGCGGGGITGRGDVSEEPQHGMHRSAVATATDAAISSSTRYANRDTATCCVDEGCKAEAIAPVPPVQLLEKAEAGPGGVGRLRFGSAGWR